MKIIIDGCFSYALANKFLNVNPAMNLALPKSVKKKPYHARTIDSKKTLTIEQIQVLVEKSKETPIHMQVLLNVLVGLRRQEINGVKYSDVDYINRTLSVERQLGKMLVRNEEDDDGTPKTKQELRLKTRSSKRELPIPDIVFEAILQARKQYEENLRDMETIS